MDEQIVEGKAKEIELYALLDHLSQSRPSEEESWEDIKVIPIHAGSNNLLYRVCGPRGDLAVKFTIQDKRARAMREYRALLALQGAGLQLAPKPVLLDITRYSQPVVVQEWLSGEVSPGPPEDDDGWSHLLEHYVAVHALTPNKSEIRLQKAVLNFANAREGVETVLGMARALSRSAWPAELEGILRRLRSVQFPGWEVSPVKLCRVDPNILNFVRRPEGWFSVDWENSGWGDAAFEIADLLAHPAYQKVLPERAGWIVKTYARLAGDPHASVQIQVYYPIMLASWVVRTARYLYEAPLGLDPRLAKRPDDWESEMRAKYDYYVQLAERTLTGAVAGQWTIGDG